MLKLIKTGSKYKKTKVNYHETKIKYLHESVINRFFFNLFRDIMIFQKFYVVIKRVHHLAIIMVQLYMTGIVMQNNQL